MLKDETHASKPGNLLNDRGYQVENCEEIENKSTVQCSRFTSWGWGLKRILDDYLGRLFCLNMGLLDHFSHYVFTHCNHSWLSSTFREYTQLHLETPFKLRGLRGFIPVLKPVKGAAVVKGKCQHVCHVIMSAVLRRECEA